MTNSVCPDDVGADVNVGTGALARSTGAKRRLLEIARSMSAGFALLRATLREIFDEAAYERYLRRCGTSASSKSYADFTEHIRAHRERRPRCC